MSRLSHVDHLGLGDKLRLINWGLVAIIVALGTIGISLLYSAGGMSWQPWAGPQLSRFAIGLILMMVVALTDIRVWLRIAYPFYGVMLFLLLVVEIMGHVGMGAQRWINFGFFVLQPSELMKIALVLALAKYFHSFTIEEIGHPIKLVVPVFMVLMPVGLVLLQPNLGTATLLSLASAAVMFAGGVRWWKFMIAIAIVAAIAPVAWHHLHDYQKARLMTFMESWR